jgi:hypothetical protein
MAFKQVARQASACRCGPCLIGLAGQIDGGIYYEINAIGESLFSDLIILTDIARAFDLHQFKIIQ